MINVHATGAAVVVNAPSRMADLLAKMPTMRADQEGTWWGPDTPSTWFAIANTLAGFPGFEPTAKATARMKYWRTRMEAIRQVKALGPPEDSPAWQGLYEFQKATVHLLAASPGFLVGDEMGTGKTVMALTAARQVKARWTLVVAPNSMKYRWAAEAATWYPEAHVVVLQGTKAQKVKAMDEAQDYQAGPVIVVVNWESLRILSRVAGYGSTKLTDADREKGPLNQPWDVVIADEAHRAKDPKSKQTRALWAIGAAASYRWALTGPPVLNTPGDLWAIGRFIDPDTYGSSRHKWHGRYVAFIDTQWGPKDIGLNHAYERELLLWFDMQFIRRTKAEVLDLPPVTGGLDNPNIRHLELEPKQRTAYRKMVKDMIAAFEGGVLVAADPLTLMTRLSQIASATPVLDSDGQVIALDAPSNKVKAVLEILEEGDEQVVVFAASRKLIELTEAELQRKGITTVSVTGAITPEQRAVNVARFQDGEAQVCLCTLGAGSEGITLTAATRAVFMQRSYGYAQSVQAEARIHRIGQENHVEIIDLVSLDTVDEEVIDALSLKGEMSEEVLRDRMKEILS